jgi:hypothetical protein
MSLLKRLLFGNAPKRIEHPVFGEALLMRAKLGSYWEVETEVAGRRFTIAIETLAEEEPTDEQVKFFERYSRDPDSTFRAAAPLLVPEFEKWTRGAFPTQWQEAFEFVGMSVPVEGDERNPWDLSFECLKDRGRHLFTCTFRDGKPAQVQIDG